MQFQIPFVLEFDYKINEYNEGFVWAPTLYIYVQMKRLSFY